MPLTSGEKLGPYQILAPLGAGGMGEVYKARDTRLDRLVAIKTSKVEFSERFEREAKAVGALNHSNICQLYDVGPNYLVMEYIEGTPLKGPLPVDQALKYGAQICDALDAAHKKGITHRDLKPGNILVAKAGIKLLDFGLAKFGPAGHAPKSPDEATVTMALTGKNEIVGTLYYMSPEQLQAQATGKEIDGRSDIFSFGLVLYEMLSGKRAFEGSSPASVIAAILERPAPSIAEIAPAALDRALKRCLEKDPDNRWQTARDLKAELEWIASDSQAERVVPRAEKKRLRLRTIAFSAGAVLVAALSYVAGGRATPGVEPRRFQRLTFGHGIVTSARIAPEGRTIVYSASWEGKPNELFTTRVDNRESRTLGIQNAQVASISSTGEMALLLCRDRDAQQCLSQNSAVLARVPLAGGAPREILGDVGDAQWTPDGSQLAVTHRVDNKTRIEFPIGNVVYETEGFVPGMGGTSISPDGKLLAFAEQPTGGTEFTLNTIDQKRQRREVSTGWAGEAMSVAGWTSARELWVAPQPGGTGAREIYAADLAGGRRVLVRVPGLMFLLDVHDGRALIAQGNYRVSVSGRPPGESGERDFSWFDASEVEDMTADGKTLLITEFGDGGDSSRWSIYLRSVNESLPVRLGDGVGCALSPDGARVISIRQSNPEAIVILPTGAGEPQVLQNPTSMSFSWAGWLPSQKEIAFIGASSGPGHPVSLYVEGLQGGPPRLVANHLGNTYSYRLVSPDGKIAIAPDASGHLLIYPLDGSGPRPVPGARAGDHPMHWSADGKYYFFVRPRMPRAQVMKVELATGRAEAWKDIGPSDPAGLNDIYAVHLVEDGKSYFYSYVRFLNDLYLVDK